MAVGSANPQATHGAVPRAGIVYGSFALMCLTVKFRVSSQLMLGPWPDLGRGQAATRFSRALAAANRMVQKLVVTAGQCLKSARRRIAATDLARTILQETGHSVKLLKL
jgi:hypothetical protein